MNSKSVFWDNNKNIYCESCFDKEEFDSWYFQDVMNNNKDKLKLAGFNKNTKCCVCKKKILNF